MLYRAQTCHLGSDMSCVELLATLYFEVLKKTDHFIMSKGHGAAALYATLAEKGVFDKQLLENYGKEGTEFLNLVSKEVPGVEFSTGSLGHGLPVGVGTALAQKQDENPGRTYVLMSDGELQCGTTWESAMFAAHHHLDNLFVIIDYNKIQACGHIRDICKVEPLTDKWDAFGWEVRTIDGHNLKDIKLALEYPPLYPGKPVVVIAHTVKGKGVLFAEGNNDWHYKNLNEKLYTQACEQL